MLLNTVRQYLASNYMHVDNDWLSGCVEYLTDDTSNNYSENDIKNLAKEQWLLNDLKNICPGSLPPNLKNLTNTVLPGRYVLQINAAVDIGTPAYQQYLKLQKINMENVEATTKFDEKIPSHRMIKLYLTDGVQEVAAIEYRPMRNLSCDITPGCKMLVKGPVDCRRGTLLLTEGAVELLGGEVQEITISNSLPSLLSTKLGLPITQAQDLNTAQSHPRNTNIPTPHAHMPSMPDEQTCEPTNTLDRRPVAVVTSLQVASFNDDDDIIDMDQLAAIEALFNENPVKRTLSESSSNPEKKLKLDRINTKTGTSSVQTPLGSKATSKNQPIVPTNTVEDYPDDNEIFFDEDEDYLRELEAKIDAKENKSNGLENKVINVSSEPFVYIKQIKEMTDSEKAGRVYRVKAQIMKLLSKLSVGKDGWSLKCTIVDGTGSLDVDFTCDVLSKLVGYTPHEINQLKKQMVTKPELKAKAMSALQKAKETLQVLYCIVELTMLEVPKITRLVPFEAQHVDLLKNRVEGVL